jgi:superfamily II DNA or RNA helicase
MIINFNFFYYFLYGVLYIRKICLPLLCHQNNKQMKEILDQILTERGLQPRPHQVRNILDYPNPEKPHVAAIATAGGKTIMTAAKFELYYRCGLIKQNEKVLILPADKTILRGNFKKQFDKFFEKGEQSFTYEVVEDKVDLQMAIDNNVQVIIGLPQLIKDHTSLLKNVKWLVVDEAHKWYFAETITNIIKGVKPKHQFLLTGTPFKFNLHKNNYIIDYTSVKTLYSQGSIGDVNMQVLHTSLALSRMDWVSMTENLRGDKRLTKKDLDKSFTEVIQELVKKLKLPLKKLSTTHNISKNAMSVFGKLQKTIIFTHGIPEANIISKYLETCGVNCITSHSKIDGEIAEDSFNSFRDDENIKVLVSVNRGKEGFDFPELYNIIDMTYSQNFEVVMQMIGRLLRPSKDETFKVFYKVAPRNTSGYFTDWMDCLIQLFDDYWYSKFNGRNTLDIRVPNALLNRPKTPKTPTFIQDGNKKIEIASGSSLNKGTKIQVVGADNKKVPLKDGKYKVPQPPTSDNPKPAPIEIEVKKGVITKTTAPITRGRMLPKNLQTMGFDNSLSFMEKNDWFRLEDPLSTVATTTLRKVIYNFNGSIHNKDKKGEIFLSFSECKEFVKTIDNKWKSSVVWTEYCQSGLKPKNIPSSPYKVFEDEWIDWADWFGTDYLTSKDAIKFVHTLGLKSESEWSKYCQSGDKPDNIPTSFRTVYKNEKITTGEWLGTNRISDWEKVFVTLDELKVLVKEWGINNKTQWYDYWKVNEKPSNIPANPSVIYKREDVWVSWPNLFGLDKRSSGSETMTFIESRTFVHKLKLKGNQGWRDYSKSGNKPTTLPGAPDVFYKEEWTDWKDFLGDETMRTPNKKK